MDGICNRHRLGETTFGHNFDCFMNKRFNPPIASKIRFIRGMLIETSFDEMPRTICHPQMQFCRLVETSTDLMRVYFWVFGLLMNAGCSMSKELIAITVQILDGGLRPESCGSDKVLSRINARNTQWYWVRHRQNRRRALEDGKTTPNRRSPPP